jgi:hypothetical protein
MMITSHYGQTGEQLSRLACASLEASVQARLLGDVRTEKSDIDVTCLIRRGDTAMIYPVVGIWLPLTGRSMPSSPRMCLRTPNPRGIPGRRGTRHSATTQALWTSCAATRPDGAAARGFICPGTFNRLDRSESNDVYSRCRLT